MTFRLTPARRDLLAAVGRGEVTEYSPLGLGPYYSVRKSEGKRRRTVTAATNALAVEGLIQFEPKPARYKAPRVWRLTAAGAALLSEDES